MFNSFITVLHSFFSSPSGLFFSLSLARVTDARLLGLISISSTFRALETVSLKSRLSTGPLSFNLLFPAGLLSFLLKSLLAFCSLIFLEKFFLLLSGFILTLGV